MAVITEPAVQHITIETIDTVSLGDRTYLATDGEVAVVIDPQRDIERVLALARHHGVAITHVLETHVHNDYVSGGLELARRTGAAYVLPVGSGVRFDHVPARDGDVLRTGRLRIHVLHTPGHTRHHTSYALGSDDGMTHGVFTGGSLLYGATGRTDLAGDTTRLAHAQYHSVRRLARELPGATAVFPTHGFGSFCAATQAAGTSSTIAEQRQVNPALTLNEQAYVETLLAGLNAYPAYYAQMPTRNTAGARALRAAPPSPVEPRELRRRIDAGEWVVDLRDRTAFAAGHLAGSLSFESSRNFVTYLGWLYAYGTPLTLLGDGEAQITEACLELARIGIDDIAGAAVGDIATLGGGVLQTYPVADFSQLPAPSEAGVVLDVRRAEEHARGAVPGAVHIPLHELQARLAEIPPGVVWVYCGSGYRASVAASLLQRAGRTVVLVNDDFRAIA